MRYLALPGFACFAVLAGLPGCSATDHVADHAPNGVQTQAANEWMVGNMQDAAVKNAIITQHTLYPYHFETDQNTLNDLGRRDLAILAEHYRGIGGSMSVRRGTVSEEAYKARVAAVSKFLGEAGVDAARIQVSDANPGGPGMSSEQMVRVLAADRATTPYANGTASDSAGGASGSSGMTTSNK